MVKRLLGFVLLIGVVVLLLQWVSLRQSEPEPEKDVDIQVEVAPEETPKEAPAPEPESSTPPTAEQTPSTPPAPADKPPEPPPSAATEQAPEASPADEQRPSEPPVAEREDSSPESEPPAPAATEQERTAPPATEEEKPPPEPEPPASPDAETVPTTPPAAETSAPAESESPSAPTTEPTQSASPAVESEASSSESESLPPSVAEQAPAPTAAEAAKSPAVAEPPASPAPSEPKAPSDPDPTAPEETMVEERVVPDEEFVAIEQAQGRTDERTDAQRRHQNQDGWYGWGVLADYADPDRAARLLGGAAAVQRDGSFFHASREHGWPGDGAPRRQHLRRLWFDCAARARQRVQATASQRPVHRPVARARGRLQALVSLPAARGNASRQQGGQRLRMPRTRVGSERGDGGSLPQGVEAPRCGAGPAPRQWRTAGHLSAALLPVRRRAGSRRRALPGARRGVAPVRIVGTRPRTPGRRDGNRPAMP